MINYKNYAERFLKEAVESLDKQYYPKDKYQLFIVDNSSSEKSHQTLKQLAPQAEIIRNIGEKINDGNNGYALANNQAFKIALEENFEYIIASNMDVVFDKNWLEELVKTAEQNKKAGAIQAKILLHRSLPLGDSCENVNKINSSGNKLHYLGFGYCEDYNADDYEIEKGKKINYASGCSVLYKAEALKKVGLYDEEYFMYHEDTDLSWRIWQAGYEVILSPEARVYHKYEFNRSILMFYYMERNRFLTILTNYQLKTLFLILPALFFMELGLFLYAIKNGLWKSKLRVYLYFTNPLNLYKIYKSRKAKQNKRVVNDKDIAKNFTGKLEFQEVANPILTKIANPIFNLYWTAIKKLI
jgi:GT2 family glycosyltransferase